MRSLADRARPAAEWVLRALAVALLAWWLVRAVRGDAGGREERAAPGRLRAALVRWSTVAAPERVQVRLAAPPPAGEREWLAALAGAGTAVTWGGEAAIPTAVAMERVADPAGGVRISVAAPRRANVVLGDETGPLDSAAASTAVSRFQLGAIPASVTARVGEVVARSAPRDSLVLRSLLVLGQGGWETKFVTTALEERGWKVDAYMAISPKSNVRQGDARVIDTARYAAVVVLDSTAAAFGARVRRYVADGGGLVMWSGAANIPALAPLTAGRMGTPVAGDDIQPGDTAPRLALGLAPIVDLRADAVVLERRDAAVAVAARRVGLGRVVQVGYEDVWRWRMRGGDDAPDAHRAWLAGLVASVAYTGAIATPPPRTDEAPFVALVDRLGAPSASLAPDADDARRDWSVVIFAVLCAALFVEWASRRTRGLR